MASWRHEHVTVSPQGPELDTLASHLRPDLGDELRRLVSADSRAHQVVDLEQRAQRAEDLAHECRRQLKVRDRQVDAARREGRGSVVDVVGERETHADRGWTAEHDQMHGAHHLVKLSQRYAGRSDTGYYQRDDLVKAASLLLAAIDVLDRRGDTP